MHNQELVTRAVRSQPEALEPLHSSFGRARARAERHKTTLSTVDGRFALGRLVFSVALLAVLAAVFPKFDPTQKFLAILGGVVLFAVVSHIHHRLQRKLRAWQGLAASYALSEARVGRDFAALRKACAPWHEPHVKRVPPGHVYAVDLDVPTNLFLFLDTCSTPEASARLLDDLLTVGLDVPDLEARTLSSTRSAHLARERRLLREMEALRLDETFLAEYLQKEPSALPEGNTLPKPAQVILAVIFALVSIAAWAFFLFPKVLEFFRTADSERLAGSLMIYAVFPIVGVAVLRPLVEAAQRVDRRAKTLAIILAHMKRLRRREGFPAFTCLTDEAASHIGRLGNALSLLSLRGNPLLWIVLHLLAPFDALLSLFLLVELKKVLPRFDEWWREAIEFDRLCALARLSVENPSFRFLHPPTGPDGQTKFAGEEVGHPLLPAHARVCNSFTFSSRSPVILLTGSNMAGKSTFLRTLGVNMLLFNMGAPVCARTFEVACHRVLCAIRVDDSLSEGTSYFYAEVKRLKRIVEELEGRGATRARALFLVDEIFRGTNNRERFLGSWYLLKSFLDANTFGLVSTHDLALAALESRDGRLRNMHFREHVDSGKLVFDYILREGPCPTTNALHIMRAEGLPIPADDALREAVDHHVG